MSLLSLQVPEARATHRPLPASILSANTDFMAQSPDWRASASCHHTKTGSIACLCHFGTRKSVDVAFFHSFTAKLTDITQIALLEWSASLHDLITVSIHTYERAPPTCERQISVPLRKSHLHFLGLALPRRGPIQVRAPNGSRISVCRIISPKGCPCRIALLPIASGSRRHGPRL